VLRSIATTFGLDGLIQRSAAADLRVVGETLEDQTAKRMVLALGGLALGPATVALMIVGGVAVPVAVPAFLSVALGVVGFFVPAITLRSQADERRQSFRHALSSFLDLVAITLAGGAGVETALERSAKTGRGWAFEELRQALLASRLQGETPWAGLDRLGSDLGIVELQELAASVGLAGEDGARIRTSLASKARSLRTRGLTETEGKAHAATERMSIPIVLLMVGFMIFVIFPAIDRITTGL
jgi:Flp pilus assembly protein TadB